LGLVPPPATTPEGQLSDEGRQQVRELEEASLSRGHARLSCASPQIYLGRRKCSPLQVGFVGDERQKPITSAEVAWLVRFSYILSKYIEARTGYRVNLRFIAAYAFHVLVALAAFTVWLLYAAFS
jgi:hypothetical protein